MQVDVPPLEDQPLRLWNLDIPRLENQSSQQTFTDESFLEEQIHALQIPERQAAEVLNESSLTEALDCLGSLELDGEEILSSLQEPSVAALMQVPERETEQNEMARPLLSRHRAIPTESNSDVRPDASVSEGDLPASRTTHRISVIPEDYTLETVDQLVAGAEFAERYCSCFFCIAETCFLARYVVGGERFGQRNHIVSATRRYSNERVVLKFYTLRQTFENSKNLHETLSSRYICKSTHTDRLIEI